MRQLNKIEFTEAVKRTTPYLKEKAEGIRKLIASKQNIDRMHEYYGQACRYEMGIDYLRQNPNICPRDIEIIRQVIDGNL